MYTFIYLLSWAVTIRKNGVMFMFLNARHTLWDLQIANVGTCSGLSLTACSKGHSKLPSVLPGHRSQGLILHAVYVHVRTDLVSLAHIFFMLCGSWCLCLLRFKISLATFCFMF